MVLQLKQTGSFLMKAISMYSISAMITSISFTILKVLDSSMGKLSLTLSLDMSSRM